MAFGNKFKIIVVAAIFSAMVIEAGFVFYDYFYSEASEFLLLPKPTFLNSRLQNAVNSEFSLSTIDNGQVYSIKPEILQSWLISRYRNFLGYRVQIIDESKIKDFLISLPIEIATQPINGRLALNSEGILFEISPSRKGKVLNLDKSSTNIVVSLKKGNNWSELAFDDISPKVSLDTANGLGINTLLGVGESNFNGSSQARIQNIKIGAAIYNGIIIKPGEEFSFNGLLGPVDASGGYRPELVVKNKTLIPEYGGGLCQVSTTVFRAAISSGLAITERRPHSLPVRYYNPQGFDATIYPGITDLKFKNNTVNHILIQSYVRDTILSFQIFGVNDGRKINIDGPHIYESNPDGGMKTVLTQLVTFADGTMQKNTFYSTYKSPALFPTVKNPLE